MDSFSESNTPNSSNFAPGTRLGRYEIRSIIGKGGMGEIYLVHDTDLDRPAALKFLLPEFASDNKRLKRFVQEARAASALNHPNILTIYEIGKSNGAHFCAMEFVQGETLRKRMIEPVLIRNVLDIVGQIAAALSAAHSVGIIHRDIKPENVVIREDGLVKLLDFGIAKLTDEFRSNIADSNHDETSTGMIIGTASYMSPEQARGRAVDARSDLFSLGVVAYEMITRQKPFAGENAFDVIGSILHKEPVPLRLYRADAPSQLGAIVERLMRKDLDQRYQSATDLLADLKRLQKSEEDKVDLSNNSLPNSQEDAETQILTTSRLNDVRSNTRSRSIAVLPFVNLSADKENEYFSDGLAEEIINALTKLHGLKVIARTSSFAFRDPSRDLRMIGERLKVETILEGSVRRSGNHIRITAQLINLADESHLWADRYERELTDVFAIQDEISAAIANALEIEFVTPRLGTRNIEAYQQYLKGLYWYQLYTKESLVKEKEAFEQALKLDPGYAPAYEGLAAFYFGLGALSIKSMREMAPLATSAAEKALAIDPSLSEAQSVIGLVRGAVDYDWRLAEQLFRTALNADDVKPLVRVRYALYFLTPMGRFTEAIEEYHRALETDPLSMMVHFGLSFAYYCNQQYDKAIAHARNSVELYPEHWLVHFALGMALSQQGNLRESIESLETVAKLSPAFTLNTGFLAAAYARIGNKDHAESLIDRILEKKSTGFISPSSQAVYHAAIGDTDKMFDDLEGAFAERDPYLTRVDAEPYFAPYRSDPRFRAILKAMNLG